MTGATIPCPQCQEPVPEGAQECGTCGADLLPDLAAPGSPDTAPEIAGSPTSRTAAPAEGSRSFDEQVRSFLYLCPACGTFVRAEDTACEKCGATLGGEHEANVPGAEEPVTQELRRCPLCAAAVPVEQATCGVCGTSLSVAAPEPERAPAPPPSEAIGKEEALTELEQLVVKDEPWETTAEPADENLPPPPVSADASDAIKPMPRPSDPPHVRADRAVRMAPAPWMELAVVVTGLAVPLAAVAAAMRVPGNEWGQLFLFGVLFGVGLNLAIAEVRPVARSLPLLLWVAGSAVLLTLPTAALLGLPWTSVAGLVLLGAGAGLVGVSMWRLPRTLGVHLPWLSGLLLLTVVASVSVALRTLGDSLVTASVWFVGGTLVVGPSILTLRRRVRTGAAERALAQAEEALSRRDYGRALRLYDESLTLSESVGRNPDAALYGKGAALVAIGELDEGLRVLERALSANPQNEVAWVNKGTALTRMGRLQDALRCYNSAIKVNARYEVAWNNKGNALSRLGKDEGALQCYEQALTLDPSYRTAWVNKGHVLAKLGRFEEAAKCADRALQLTAGASA